jgi:putative oxidoreductase
MVVGLAVLMIAHAKLEYDYGGGSIAGVGRLFEQAGVPLRAVTGPGNLLLEAIGGVALILGLGVPVVGALMALNMLGAWVLVHPTALYAADDTGPETVIAIGRLSLVLAVTGSGRLGLDHPRRGPSDDGSMTPPGTWLPDAVLPASQQVPSRWTCSITARVSASSSPKRTRTWLITTSLTMSMPGSTGETAGDEPDVVAAPVDEAGQPGAASWRNAAHT